jgi:hypothetical protein
MSQRSGAFNGPASGAEDELTATAILVPFLLDPLSDPRGSEQMSTHRWPFTPMVPAHQLSIFLRCTQADAGRNRDGRGQRDHADGLWK